MTNVDPLEQYKEIEQDRRAWGDVITSRDRLFLPLAIAVFAFLGSQIPQFVRLGIEQFAFMIGWLLLVVLLGSWRWISHYTDLHIVRMYRDEVELEKKLGFKKRSKYIYEHLSGRSRKLLANEVETEAKKLKKWRYGEFEDHVSKLSPPKSPYDCLIRVLEKRGYWAVSTRGHIIWDLAASSLLFLWLIMALVFPICKN